MVGVAPESDRDAPEGRAGYDASATAVGAGQAALAQAGRMRAVSANLAAELRGARRCATRDAGSYARCARDALRHAVIGGRTAALVLVAVTAPVRAGPCRGYLLALQVAAREAAAIAAWTLSQLADGSVSHRARRAAGQVRLAAVMLSRASAPGGEAACAVGAGGPPA